MIDLHCHILHGMDDGPSDVDESVALCRTGFDNHIIKIVLTPHMTDLRNAEQFIRRRDRKMDELKQELNRFGIPIELFPGAEVYIDDTVFYENGLEQFTINRSRYLLVEFPCSGLNQNCMVNYIAEIKSRGLIPIIAHPERYAYFRRDFEMMRHLAQKGALYQVNADSLCKQRGRVEYKLARWLVKQNMVSFLATDAHSVDHRPNNLLEQLICLPAEVRSEWIDDMVNGNPELVLQDRELAR